MLEGCIDLHLHTTCSDGLDTPEVLVGQALEQGYRAISITDHDDIRGSYQAREMAAKKNYRFEVVMGMEVTTLHGHLIAAFIEEPVAPLARLNTTVEAIHRLSK